MRESLCRDLSLDRFLHQDESHPLSVLWTPQRSDDSVLFWSDRSLVRTFAASDRSHRSGSSLTAASPFSTEVEAGQGQTYSSRSSRSRTYSVSRIRRYCRLRCSLPILPKQSQEERCSSSTELDGDGPRFAATPPKWCCDKPYVLVRPKSS